MPHMLERGAATWRKSSRSAADGDCVEVVDVYLQHVREMWQSVNDLRLAYERDHGRDPGGSGTLALAHRIGRRPRTVNRWSRRQTMLPILKDFTRIVEFYGGDVKVHAERWQAAAACKPMKWRKKDLDWWKSTRSAENGDCVEVSNRSGVVAMRDSKDPSGTVLSFRKDNWRAFIEGVRSGEFDLPDFMSAA